MFRNSSETLFKGLHLRRISHKADTLMYREILVRTLLDLTSQCKLRHMCVLCPICMRQARGQVEADPGNKAFAPAGGRFDPWD